MLSSLSLTNFKSFADVDTVPLSHFTLMIGANGSGKSNLFDAIRFLQGCALGLTIADVLEGRMEGGRETWLGIRGGAAEVSKDETQAFSISVSARPAGLPVTYKIACKGVAEPCVERESLVETYGERDYFDTHADSLKGSFGLQPGGAIKAAFRKSKGKGNRPSKAFSASKSILSQGPYPAGVDHSVSDVSGSLLSLLRDIRFLNISPSLMRDYAPKHQSDQLLWQGDNLSAVMWRLCQDAGVKAELIDWLSELVAPQIVDIKFAETPLNDAMLMLVEKSGKQVSARSLSDGTLRFLGQLIALRTAREGSTLLIEEIENGLHPTRAELMTQLFESMTANRKVQVLATTHSPAILGALSDETRKRALIFARDPSSQSTIVKALGRLGSYDEVVERRGIEYMMRTGWLERAV